MTSRPVRDTAAAQRTLRYRAASGDSPRGATLRIPGAAAQRMHAVARPRVVRRAAGDAAGRSHSQDGVRARPRASRLSEQTPPLGVVARGRTAHGVHRPSVPLQVGGRPCEGVPGQTPSHRHRQLCNMSGNGGMRTRGQRADPIGDVIVAQMKWERKVLRNGLRCWVRDWEGGPVCAAAACSTPRRLRDETWSVHHQRDRLPEPRAATRGGEVTYSQDEEYCRGSTGQASSGRGYLASRSVRQSADRRTGDCRHTPDATTRGVGVQSVNRVAIGRSVTTAASLVWLRWRLDARRNCILQIWGAESCGRSAWLLPEVTEGGLHS